MLGALQMRVLLASAERPAAYVRLHYMGSETTRALAAALRRAEAERCLGVILDLRNNPGVHGVRFRVFPQPIPALRRAEPSAAWASSSTYKQPWWAQVWI